MKRQIQAQWLVKGVVAAPVERTWKTLLDLNPNLLNKDRDAIKASQMPLVTIATGKSGAGRIHIEVDAQHHTITTQGEWWYRGVHSVEPHANGSLVVYRVYNVAPGVGWWAAQLVQGPQHAREMSAQFQSLLERIGEHLNCEIAFPNTVSGKR